jgi:hypothetical protein
MRVGKRNAPSGTSRGAAMLLGAARDGRVGKPGAAASAGGGYAGVRVGEASNPGPGPYPPGIQDPAHLREFPPYGDGWVALTFSRYEGHGVWGAPLAFRGRAPLGGDVAKFEIRT